MILIRDLLMRTTAVKEKVTPNWSNFSINCLYVLFRRSRHAFAETLIPWLPGFCVSAPPPRQIPSDFRCVPRYGSALTLHRSAAPSVAYLHGSPDLHSGWHLRPSVPVSSIYNHRCFCKSLSPWQRVHAWS